MKSLFWNTLYPFVRGVFFLIFVSTNVNSQPWRRPEISTFWFFGKEVGLDFKTNPPVQVFGSLCVKEASSTICDSMGNLLFYTDGIKVYNSNNQLMQNGDGLGSGLVKNWDCYLDESRDLSSSTQGALIIPQSKTNNLYYIFTTNCMEDGNTGYMDDPTQYSIVDMLADSGRGAVVQKNVMIHPRGTEKQAAVRHANGRDWWHLFHVANSDSFGIGLINDTLQYRYQKTGNIVWNTEDSLFAGAEMRFNWKGDMLVDLVQQKDSVKIDFFNFLEFDRYCS